MERIDLSKCRKGDVLISSQGAILEYVAPTPYEHFTYLDHVVKYITDENGKKIYGDECYGTRTNDGFVFLKKRIPETDNDIVKIIHLDDIIKDSIPRTKVEVLKRVHDLMGVYAPKNFSENDPKNPYLVLAEEIRKKVKTIKVIVEKEQYNESFHKAVEYVQEHYCENYLKTPYMLLGDVAELIKITTGKEIDVNVLAKYSNK